VVYSYDGIKTELENRLALLSNWQKTLWGGIYDVLLSSVSYAIDKRCLYPAEVYFRESNIMTATKYESMIPLADGLSYSAYRQKGAVGTIQLSADSTFSSSYVYAGSTVAIEQWAQFTDQTGAIAVYCTERTVYYAVTSGNLDIPVKEGIPKEFLYIASGAVNEVVSLFSNSVDNDEIYVYRVDANNQILDTIIRVGIDVTERKLFYINDLVDYYCQIDNAYDFEKVTITFGNGVSNNKLTAGDRILIKYADTKGDLGNILNTTTITKIKNTLYDVNGDAATLYVTNQAAITNGSAYETIESIRYNAINLFQTGYRCGGYTDWIEVLQAHPSIHKAIIWSTDDVADDTLTTAQNKIYVTAITNTGVALSTIEQADITVNYLKDKKSPCELVAWQTLNTIYAAFRIDATVQTLSIPVISTQINETLDDLYSILNTDFKVDIYESNFTSAIDNNEYVLHNVTEIYNMEKGFAANSQNYTLATSVVSADQPDPLKQIYLLPNSLEIWLRINAVPSYPITAAPVMVAYDLGGTITAHNNTYVDILLGSPKLNSDATGLANNATIYTAHMHVSGGGAIPIAITGSASQTIAAMVTQINVDIVASNLIAVFDDGDDYIRISVTTLGASTVVFTDVDIVSTLFGGATATVDTPVPGFKYTIINEDIVYATNKISFNVTDLAMVAPTNFELVVQYKTKDGNGGQTNDLRLPAFNYITSTDSNYNTFDMTY